MKKIIVYFLLCLISIIGCNANNANSNTISNTILKKNGNIFGNLNNREIVAQQGEWIYYSEFQRDGLKKQKEIKQK